MSALAVTAASLLLLLSIALLRLLLIRRQRRTAAVYDRWRPLLAMAAAGDLSSAPTIGRAEGEFLLPLWNQLRESVRGESEASLDTFARHIGLDRIAAALLASGNARARLLAINTLGHIGTTQSIAALERYCHQDNPAISLAAVCALLRIDSKWVLPGLVPLMLARADWSIARLLPMLRSADGTRLELALAESLPHARGAARERLLLLAGALPQERVSKWARIALQQPESTDQIAAALRLVSDPHDAPLVRRLLRHPVWQVRVRAAAAMERVAASEDLPHLVVALADSEWWVRLRAARTLARLPFLSDVQLARLRDSVSDRFARDALSQAIAEERNR